MPDLLKPSRSPAGPSHGIFIARTDVVAKTEIEQFWSNRLVAGPWPGRCSGYGWLLLLLCGAGLLLTHGRVAAAYTTRIGYLTPSSFSVHGTDDRNRRSEDMSPNSHPQNNSLQALQRSWAPRSYLR